MTERTLTLRELNRATLARQMLLERESLSVSEAVEHLVGLQSQIPNPPYIGLWTRLHGFKRDDLTDLMKQRRIVRAAMMRSTLHLVTAADHQRFRPVIQPALTRALNAFFGQRARGINEIPLIEAARSYLDEKPRTTADLRRRLLEVEPECDPNALAYIVRTYLPLVQVPPAGTWGSGGAGTYVTADFWLGKNTQTSDLRQLFRRYLTAFGPASIMDFQTWTGMTKLQDALTEFKSEFRVFRDEQGKELFDLPDLALPFAETPAPVRFLPEYDNLLLAHTDRTRIIANEYRSKVFLSAGRVRATFLVDGFVRGTWKVEKSKDAAILVIEPFTPLAAPELDQLAQEAKPLIQFIEDQAAGFEVRVSA